MRRDELIEALRASPFRPFRLHVSDGAAFDIHHPEILMVFRASAIVGVPVEQSDTNGSTDYPDLERYSSIDLRHITRIEELQPR